MIINVTSCKSKMVVILATSLALGVSAVAACVVPWLYCKPADAADDDRALSSNEDDCTTPTVGLEVNGSNFVKVYINPGSIVNPDITPFFSRQNETVNSTSFNEYLPQNPMDGAMRLLVQTDGVRDQSQRDVDSRVAGVASVVSTELNTKNSENTCEDTEALRRVRSLEATMRNREILESNADYPDSTEPFSSNATEQTEQSRDTQFLEVVVGDIQMVESGLSNSEPTESSFVVKVEVNGTDTQQTIESSNPTNESSTGTTLTASSGVSDFDHSESSVQISKQSAEKTRPSSIAKVVESTSRIARTSKVESTESELMDEGSSIPDFLERGCIDRNKDGPTPLRTCGPSDPKKAFHTEKTDVTVESRKFNTFVVHSKVSAIAAVESSKISEDLDTIVEVSSCSELSEEGSPLPASSPAVLPTSSNTFDSAQFISHNRQNSDIKKMSRRACVASRFSNGFKRFFHGIRLDRTPRFSHEELPRELHTESVHSVSAGEKFPAGHSTLIHEDRRLFNNVRSMTSYMCLQKPLEDPRIVPHDHQNVAECELRGNDLSIRASSVCNEETKGELTFEDKESDGTSDGTRQLLRKVKGYLRARIARSSDNETSHSDSLKSKKPVRRDKNQNFLSGSSTAVKDAKLHEHRELISDSDANFNTPKINNGKRKIRSLKNIFKFGNRNKNKGNDKVSYVGRKKTGANIVPVEFQRNSMGTCSKPRADPNGNFESATPESQLDSPSYQELNFGILDDVRNLREPCTEL